MNKGKKRREGTDENIKVEEWIGYFKELLGGVEGRVIRRRRRRREEHGEWEIMGDDVRGAIRKLREGKVVGGDGISGEIWKYGREKLEGCVWGLCNKIWRGEEWIEE